MDVYLIDRKLHSRFLNLTNTMFRRLWLVLLMFIPMKVVELVIRITVFCSLMFLLLQYRLGQVKS